MTCPFLPFRQVMVLCNCKLKCRKLGVWFLCGSLVHIRHNVAQLRLDYNRILQLVAFHPCHVFCNATRKL